jgi:hypothetical protein
MRWSAPLRNTILGSSFVTLLSLAATPAVAAAQTRTATVNVSIDGVARMSLSVNAITFPDSNPSLVTQVSPTSGPLTITVKARTPLNSTVRLSVLASDDLRSGVRTIPASTITWTTSGTGFVPGTLNRTTPQAVGTWIGSGARTGTQSLLFANSWNHPAGTFTLTMTYTLSSP